MKQLIGLIITLLLLASCGIVNKVTNHSKTEKNRQTEIAILDTTKKAGFENNLSADEQSIQTIEISNDDITKITVTETEKTTEYGIDTKGDTIPKQTREKTTKTEYEKKNKASNTTTQENSSKAEISSKGENENKGISAFQKEKESGTEESTNKDTKRFGFDWYIYVAGFVILVIGIAIWWIRKRIVFWAKRPNVLR